MDAVSDYHTKWSMSETERQILYHTWNLKHDTNEPIYETERFVDMEKRLVAVKGGEGGMECEVGLADYKLLYI